MKLVETRFELARGDEIFTRSRAVWDQFVPKRLATEGIMH